MYMYNVYKVSKLTIVTIQYVGVGLVRPKNTDVFGNPTEPNLYPLAPIITAGCYAFTARTMLSQDICLSVRPPVCQTVCHKGQYCVETAINMSNFFTAF